ncbi:uncharacterized protein LOC132532853 [Erinaceus europaeus]|uniref:Uncharacterized protein LOC132532853 n=1 Tax=Erinaceus europaeus TaxID=9365 RepID=A0ABM3VV66_ERIEU|nr:uncharacterized protein LOC132532853 [Erinaceus europaeus]
MPSRAKGRSRPKQSKACCPGRVTALCLRVRNCLWKLCLRSCCQLEKPEPYCTETDVIEGEPSLCEETEQQQETQNVCSDAPYLLVSEERYRGGLPAQAGGCCNRKGHRVRLVVSGYHLHGDIVLHRPPQSPQLAEHTAPAPQSSPQPEGTAEVARAAEGPLPSTPPPAQPENLQARPRVIPWQIWLLSLCARTSMESEVAQLAVVPGHKLNLPSLRHKLIFFLVYCVITAGTLDEAAA